MDGFEVQSSVGFDLHGSRPSARIQNPADITEVVGAVDCVEPSDVDRAVAVAADAQVPWSRWSTEARLDTILAALESLEGLANLDTLLVREQGKVREEAKVEIASRASHAERLSFLAESVDTREVLRHGGQETAWISRKPFGVVGIITPSNWPVGIALSRLLPALLAGNSVLLCVSPTAPLTILKVCRALAQVLPRGVLLAFAGEDARAPRRLVKHPRVRKISFTGSVRTGRDVVRGSASNMKDLTLELGGNDAAIVLKDAPLNGRLFSDIIEGAFTTAGQVCMAIKRVYVPSNILTDFADGLSHALSDAIIGNGLNQSTTMGPVHTRTQRERVLELVQEARSSGSIVRECGEFAVDPETGWFVKPTLVTKIDNESRLVQEEQFAPVLPIVGYSSEDEALQMANSTEYGLAGSIWSVDIERARHFAHLLDAGTTWINAHGIGSRDWRAPFGGTKQSGIGRLGGRCSVESYTEAHTVSLKAKSGIDGEP